ncbi:MAG: hypothetical protein M1823_003317 [Watsoniomyces obsoletus]|nr:MAG: hypothetical protein M1823_003317 [Watsoniomyces obsoletus]
MTIVSSRPRQGHLQFLRTKAEVSATEDVIDVYVVEIPAKAVNNIINFLRRLIPSPTANLQHIQRVVRPDTLPVHLRPEFLHNAQHQNDASLDSLNGETNGSTVDEGLLEGDTNPATTPDSNLFLVVSRTTEISRSELVVALAAQPIFRDASITPRVYIVSVPQLAPASEEQAREQSAKYWPTLYKNGNPYGPHPSIISRAEAEVNTRAGLWMGLAQETARQVAIEGEGEAIGAVVVDRSASELGSLVIVAGDARWWHPDHLDHHRSRGGVDKGNAINHAAMRAIGMVARRRRDQLEHTPRKTPSSSLDKDKDKDVSNGVVDAGLYLDRPLTAIEEAAFAEDVLAPKGYLCVGLDLYITHEPCIMCSMALLHSRFDRVIFGQNMPRTGGLVAETTFRRIRELSSPVEEEIRRPHETTGDNHDETECEEHIENHANGSSPGNTAVVVPVTNEEEEGLGYGLFWRAELNWRFLAWKWNDADPESLLGQVSMDINV